MTWLYGWQYGSHVSKLDVLNQPKQNWQKRTGVEKTDANLSKRLHTTAYDAATVFIHLSCYTHHLSFKHHPLGHFA